MNKYVRSIAFGLSLGVVTGCEVNSEPLPDAKAYEFQRYVDPDIQSSGLGKVVCGITSREPIYKNPFNKKDAQLQLRAVTNTPDATLETAIEMGVTCQKPLQISEIEKGLAIVVIGEILDTNGKLHKIQEACLVAGYPVSKVDAHEYAKVSAFCPDRQVGHI